MKTKVHFTLERLLDETLRKEHVQDILEEHGENPSGQKPELIDRLLESRRIQSKSVDTVAREILEDVPAADLKDLGYRLNIRLPSTKKGMVRELMKCLSFEPYVREIERDCPICKMKTVHELHFGPDWKASYARCRTCNNDTDLRATDNQSNGLGEDEASVGESVKKKRELSPDIALTLKVIENTNHINPTEIIHQTVQQAKIMSDHAASKDEVLRYDRTHSEQSIAMLEATRREQRRGNLLTVAGIVLSLGIGIPTLGATFDNRSAFVYLAAGIPFLCVSALIGIYIIVTRHGDRRIGKKVV